MAQFQKKCAEARLSMLLDEVPGSEDFLFWHIVETRGYSRPAGHAWAVEPYPDGSTLQTLRSGIGHLVRRHGDATAIGPLCELLLALFEHDDPALYTFMSHYMRELGRENWDAEHWVKEVTAAAGDFLILQEMWVSHDTWRI
ncbi:hypothetical protein [Streptomyces sp. NPDC098781]|uniref:hypothetical protein n=1 Tax=Streptomyces sp. NPDC098781 TaxID=3366097 RepID=UPI0038052E82